MESGRLSFHNEIWKNKRNSYFLVGAVLLVLLVLVYTIGLAVGGDYLFFILIFGTIFSIVYVLVGYYKSAEIAIASVGAKKASKEKFRTYHNLVEGICLASGMPKPELYVMENKQINAFASGRDPKHSVLCFTTGALEKLNKQELEGVVAHELSHVANYDIKFMTLVAVLVGMVSIIAQIFLRSLFFSSMGRDRDNKGNAIFLVIGIVLAIVAPLIVMLVQLAISRKREYGADSSAVKFMRSPTGLIGALEKIGEENKKHEMKVSGAVSPLFIAKPSRTKEWVMTHPPLEKRIARLRRM